MTSRRVHLAYLSILALSVMGYFIPAKNLELPVEREPASLHSKMIGNLERIHIGENKDLQYFAKIDSGAESSSIHAKNIETFQKVENGQPVLYVKFETIDENFLQKTLIRPIVKVDEVRSALGSNLRYFIREKVWIGDSFYYVNVNLADRSRLKRKFLVGKNILDENYIINTSAISLTSH
ncbi:MAG: ATP-dependent zinc protease [Bdellovibrionales bacterium]|nr:ATP-dependent zinc protease [Bdellovibrionales bacterium]